MNPQEYTLVKMEALELPAALSSLQVSCGSVSMMLATLLLGRSQPHSLYNALCMGMDASVPSTWNDGSVWAP